MRVEGSVLSVADHVPSVRQASAGAWRLRFGTVVLALVALAGLALYVNAERSAATGAGLPLDDAWIHLQFARNLAHGDGLSYRPGTLVSGSTAPLWTALVSLVFALPGPLLLWVKLAGVAFYVGCAAATYALARELELGRGAAAGVALLFVISDAMVWSALSGMEICLFVLLTVGGTVVHLRERRAPCDRPSMALAIFGLSSLARPEGLLLCVLALADRLLLPHPGTSRRHLLPGLAIGVACALALAAALAFFSLAASDSPLPTTYAVKTDGPSTMLPSGLYLLRVFGVHFRSHPLPLLLAAAGVLVLLERLGTPGDRGLLPALWPVALPLAYSLHDSPAAPMMVGNFGRYVFPLLPFVLVLGALALGRPLERLRAAPSGWRAVTAVLLAVLFLAPPLASLASGSQRYALNVRNVNESDVAMALWIREHLPPGALIAAQDVGAVGFLTSQPLLDLTGIVTPEILPWIEGSAGSPGGREGLIRFLGERRPDYLMLFSDSYPGLLERVGGEVLHRVRLERNVTMAGVDLVLARPSWDVKPDR